MDKFEFELIILDWKNTLNVNFFMKQKHCHKRQVLVLFAYILAN